MAQPKNLIPKKICFELLGISFKKDTHHTYGKSPIFKTLTAVIKNEGADESSQLSVTTLVLRESGLVEIYCDFELIDCFNPVFTKGQYLYCVDIETDNENFWLRFVDLEKMKSELDKPRPNHLDAIRSATTVRRMDHFWQKSSNFAHLDQQSCASSMWEVFRLKNLDFYMRLYTQWENYQGYFLLSHRNYISVYDLTICSNQNQKSDDENTSGNHWKHHLKVEGTNLIREFFFETAGAANIEENFQDLRVH